MALAATASLACSSSDSNEIGSKKATGSVWDDCGKDTDCETGLVCARPGEFGCEDTSCCVQAGEPFGACYRNGECNRGSYCDIDVCIAAGSEGDECYPDGSCDEGFRCDKETLDNRCTGFSDTCCQSVSTTGSKEQPCNADGTCKDLLACVQAEACPKSATGEQQPCCLKAGANYEPCRTDGSCSVAGLSCVKQKGATGEALWSVCLHTGALGEPCGADGTCNSGYSCAQSSSLCKNGNFCCTLL